MRMFRESESSDDWDFENGKITKSKNMEVASVKEEGEGIWKIL